MGRVSIASDEVIFDRVGTYYWVETVTDEDGTILHRGVCGAPDETTTVTEAPGGAGEAWHAG
jgi:hypothetical protein